MNGGWPATLWPACTHMPPLLPTLQQAGQPAVWRPRVQGLLGGQQGQGQREWARLPRFSLGFVPLCAATGQTRTRVRHRLACLHTHTYTQTHTHRRASRLLRLDAGARLLAASRPLPVRVCNVCHAMLCTLQMYRELGIVDPTSTLNRDQFTALLSNIDKGLRALPATAQVCRRVPGGSQPSALRQHA